MANAMKTRSNRCKLFVVSPDEVWKCLFLDTFQCIMLRKIEGLPDDACVENVYTEQLPLRFVFVLSHPSWPEIELGERPRTELTNIVSVCYRRIDHKDLKPEVAEFIHPDSPIICAE